MTDRSNGKTFDLWYLIAKSAYQSMKIVYLSFKVLYLSHKIELQNTFNRFIARVRTQ